MVHYIFGSRRFLRSCSRVTVNGQRRAEEELLSVKSPASNWPEKRERRLLF